MQGDPKTFCITLDATPDRWGLAEQHFKEHDLVVDKVSGIHAEQMGLRTVHPYEIDHPGSGYIIPIKHVGLCLSHIMVWQICKRLPDSEFLILEDDCRFIPSWREYLRGAKEYLPVDWDMLLVGSCNCGRATGGPNKRHIGKNLYQVKWPMCTHAYIVNQRGIQKLLETQTKIWAPIDLSLIFLSYPQMSGVYTILPRLANQHNTNISV